MLDWLALVGLEPPLPPRLTVILSVSPGVTGMLLPQRKSPPEPPPPAEVDARPPPPPPIHTAQMLYTPSGTTHVVLWPTKSTCPGGAIYGVDCAILVVNIL